MTVKEFIDVLKKAKDIDIAEISFHIKDSDKTYALDSLGQFSFVPDVTVTLKEIEVPLMRAVPIKAFRRDKQALVKKTINKINKDLKSSKKSK